MVWREGQPFFYVRCSSAVSLEPLAQPVITAPIVGANSVEQLEHKLAAADVTLTPEQLLRLDKVSSWQNA